MRHAAEMPIVLTLISFSSLIGAADVSLGFWLAPLEGIRFVSPLVD